MARNSDRNLVLTLIAGPTGPRLDLSTVSQAFDALDARGARPGEPDWLAPDLACDIPLGEIEPREAGDSVRAALGDRPFDVVVQPASGRRKTLLLADMESTIIANEMLDELAGFVGEHDCVAAITARAMNGEIDFADALRERVSLLAGLPEEVLDEVLGRIVVNPGARALVATMRAHGAWTCLVSGGFRHFSSPVRERLGFDEDVANVLEIVDGRITGRVREPIFDRNGKRRTLERLAAERGLSPDDAMAVGDGANDLPMLAAAGAGVAWHAKPRVAVAARHRIEHGDLSALLFLQGYRIGEISGAG